jgi:hypothetical protein
MNEASRRFALKTPKDSYAAAFLPGLDFGTSPCSGRDGQKTGPYGMGPLHASLSVAPGQGKGPPTNGTSGQCSATLSPPADRQEFSASKSPAPQLSEKLGEALQRRLSRFGSMEYGQTWKLRVTPLGLRYWAHTASGRHISGSGCTGSRIEGHPTPQANEIEESYESKIARNARMVAEGKAKGCGSPRSAAIASLAGHPTPNALPENRGGLQTSPEGAMKRRESGHMLNLDDSAQLAGYQSPNTMGGGSTSRGGDRIDEPMLGGIAKLAGHPTTAARDWRDGRSNQHGKNARPLNEVVMLAGHATPRVTTNNGLGNPDRACDGKSRLEDQCLGATPSSTATSTAKTAGYRLNPGFSLWLMIGIHTIVDAWASCGGLAMQSFRRQPKSLSKRAKKC